MTIDTLIRQRKAGILCLECGSADVEGGPFDSDNGHAWQDVACVDCSAEWRDVYQLHKVDVTNEGDERQPDEEPCGCHRWGAYQCRACRRYDARDYEDPAIPTNDND